MPRTTRAALRSKELLDESDIAASVPLPSTPLKERAPLGEITNNKGTEPSMSTNSEFIDEPVKNKVKKGKKGRPAKKGAKRTKQEPDAEVLEDDNQSSTSSAAEEACHDLKMDDKGKSDA